MHRDWPTGPNITDRSVSLRSVGGGQVDLLLIAEGCWLVNGHVCTESSALTYVWLSDQMGLFEQTLSQYLAPHFNLSRRCLIFATFHVRCRPLRQLMVVRLSHLPVWHRCGCLCIVSTWHQALWNDFNQVVFVHGLICSAIPMVVRFILSVTLTVLPRRSCGFWRSFYHTRRRGV